MLKDQWNGKLYNENAIGIGKNKLRLIEIFLKRLIKFKIVNKKMLSKYKRISTKAF